MFQLGKAIISEDIIEKDFVCNLSACKGACCIEGEAGAPVTQDETEILKNIVICCSSLINGFEKPSNRSDVGGDKNE